MGALSVSSLRCEVLRAMSEGQRLHVPSSVFSALFPITTCCNAEYRSLNASRVVRGKSFGCCQQQPTGVRRAAEEHKKHTTKCKRLQSSSTRFWQGVPVSNSL